MNWQRAVGYVRVSDESQVEGHSLDGQRHEIERYCERVGYVLERVYADEGVSAYTDQVAKRPGLAQLLADAALRQFDVVVVHTIDRWARNVSVQRHALQALGNAGVGFVSVVENFDFSTPAGRLMLTMMGGVSEFFSDQLGVHVVKGLRERAQSGLPAGPIPFGYRLGANGVAVVIPPEAEAVRGAYERRLRGDSNGEIAAWLNARGHRPRGRNQLFTPWAVRDLLRTRFYVGVVVFRNEEFPGQHEPIVASELFAGVQARRGRARTAQRPTGPSGVLRGRAFCSSCGSRLHAERNQANRPRYRERHGVACASNGRSVVSETIDLQLGALWRSLELPAGGWDTIARLAVVSPSAEARDALEAKKRRLGVAYVDGAIGEVEYRRQLVAIEDELMLLGPLSEPAYAEAAALVGDLGTVWEKATLDERRRLVSPLLSSVFIDLKERRIDSFTAAPGFDALLCNALVAPEGAEFILIDKRTGWPVGRRAGGLVETGEVQSPTSPAA